MARIYVMDNSWALRAMWWGLSDAVKIHGYSGSQKFKVFRSSGSAEEDNAMLVERNLLSAEVGLNVLKKRNLLNSNLLLKWNTSELNDYSGVGIVKSGEAWLKAEQEFEVVLEVDPSILSGFSWEFQCKTQAAVVNFSALMVGENQKQQHCQCVTARKKEDGPNKWYSGSCNWTSSLTGLIVLRWSRGLEENSGQVWRGGGGSGSFPLPNNAP